jgi:hypothetical protein
MATITFDRGKARLTLGAKDGERVVECGWATWAKGSVALLGAPVRRVAARGAWTADDTYAATLCFYETPYVVTATLRFTGDDMTLTFEQNVSFGPTKFPPLVGRWASAQ